MFLILKDLHCEKFTLPMFSNSNASNDLPKKCEKSIVYFFLFLLFLVVALYVWSFSVGAHWEFRELANQMALKSDRLPCLSRRRFIHPYPPSAALHQPGGFLRVLQCQSLSSLPTRS